MPIRHYGMWQYYVIFTITCNKSNGVTSMLLIAARQSAAVALSPMAAAPLPPHLPLNKTVTVFFIG